MPYLCLYMPYMVVPVCLPSSYLFSSSISLLCPFPGCLHSLLLHHTCWLAAWLAHQDHSTSLVPPRQQVPPLSRSEVGGWGGRVGTMHARFVRCYAWLWDFLSPLPAAVLPRTNPVPSLTAVLQCSTLAVGCMQELPPFLSLLSSYECGNRSGPT